MPETKNRLHNGKKSAWQAAGIILLLLLAVALIWSGHASSSDSLAVAATPAGVYFTGEYRIDEGPWQQIVQGQHISSTKGDVTLRGSFRMRTPDGEEIGPLHAGIPIVFYMDHINVTVYEEGIKPFVKDNENPMFGDSACGAVWSAHTFSGDGSTPVELVIHNPHRYGNENAIDELLANVAIWSGLDLEREILARGSLQRNAGVFFVIVSLVLLGTALFSTLIHIKGSKSIWLLGSAILFAGIYFIYSAVGASLWNDSSPANTTLTGCSIIFYMLFLTMISVGFLEKTRRVGIAATATLCAVDAVIFLLPLLTKLYFYDLLPAWILMQTVVNLLLLVCLVKDGSSFRAHRRWICFSMLLPLLSFELDAVMTLLGCWKGGLVSKYLFIALFLVAMVMLLRVIPHRFNAAARAKELESEKIALNAQLAESRISTMMSQIRPHFIYNTLGSIEQLCELDPPKAGELVHNFAKYLRGNFGELDNPRPIRMSQEMEHVRHYVSIENVRFPDMTFSFEMNCEDFSLPALTVQPIVENAIKHGLMKLQKGGSIRVVSYETDTDFCISVEDDGVGFDTSILQDDRGHVGLRNIRDRLKVMVHGTLEIQSTEGVGTKVLIRIPKEVQE